MIKEPEKELIINAILENDRIMRSKNVQHIRERLAKWLGNNYEKEVGSKSDAEVLGDVDQYIKFFGDRASVESDVRSPDAVLSIEGNTAKLKTKTITRFFNDHVERVVDPGQSGEGGTEYVAVKVGDEWY